MCGIVGIWDFEDNVDKSKLISMRDLLEHRGPDDKGIFIDKNIGLGHRRLSIIDLSKAGHQPMCNEDETIWITYNGEIYNFEEIKKDLEEKGHKFNSNTDTEVIIHAYEEYGYNCLELFNGMFAFAIWDSNKKEIFMARDRIGQKPLIYYFDGTKFIFASELKSILSYPGVEKKVSDSSISHYLSFGYVPSPLCIFEKFKKLQPGHYLTLNKERLIEDNVYWQINFKNKKKLGENEYCKGILKHLKEATKKRMISDVPLGAFLSGGIDSSAVVAMMAEISSIPVKTFSIGFEEQEFDETKYAGQISEKFGTEHNEKIVKMDAMKILDKLVYSYNEPYADSSAIPTYYVSKMTREKVTVALSGDAGDENFIGYNRYVPDKYDYIASINPKLLKHVSSFTGKKILSLNPRRRLFERIGVRLKHVSISEDNRYFDLQSVFDNYNKSQISTKKISEFDSSKIMLEKTKNYKNNILKKQFFDFNHYLTDDILVKVDIASMANSLEVRSPFLDHTFVEYASKIPIDMKFKQNKQKYLLKKALSKKIPKEILYRKKAGFSVPLIHWFRKDLKELSYDVLLSKRCIDRGYLNKDYLRKMLDNHNNGTDNSMRIWSLLFLEKWFRIFVD